MTPSPETWHYGLIARWWAEFNEGGPEVEYFRRFVEQGGGAALDAACGTGRLLIPYLGAGLEVDGCDISADMLEQCRVKAQRLGLSPNLYAQSLHQLDLPRKYRTIFCCGGIGVGSDAERDLLALQRFHAHLEPGGVLVLDVEMPYSKPQEWQYWTAEKNSLLPEPWPETGDRKRMRDGTELELRGRRIGLDPFRQVITRQIQVTHWADQEMLGQEEYLLDERLYLKSELQLMLRHSGFTNVRVLGEYNDAPPTPQDSMLVFVAEK